MPQRDGWRTAGIRTRAKKRDSGREVTKGVFPSSASETTYTGAFHLPDVLENAVECQRYQGLEILPIQIFCRSDIADNRQTSDHRPIEQYLPIGQCICRYAHYLPIVNAFADTYADIYRQIFFSYRQIFFSYRQIFLSIGRYRVYLPIQGLSADNR